MVMCRKNGFLYYYYYLLEISCEPSPENLHCHMRFLYIRRVYLCMRT